MRDYAGLVKRLKKSDDNCIAEHNECPAECESSYTIFLEAADAIEELQNQLRDVTKMIPHWISVEERLPEIYRRVLTYSKTRSVEQNQRCGDSSWWIGFNPTHWMPLPAPPKEVLPNGEV